MTGSNPKRPADPYAKLSQAQANRRNTGWYVIGGTVAVVAVIALVVFLMNRGDDGGDAVDGTGAAAAKDATQQTATVTVSGEDLPAYPSNTTSAIADPSTDPAVGQVAPKLVGETFDGSPVTIDPADGKPKVIIFVAHWCPHCQAEVPRIQSWIDEGKLPDGVEIYTVSTAVDESRPNYPPSNWLVKEGWTPPVLLDDDSSTAAQAYSLPGFPYFVMLDGEGQVVLRGSGEMAIEDFDAAVQDLANGGGATGDTGGSTTTSTTAAAG